MRLISIWLALFMALVVFAPATAQQEEARYKITRELTLYGDVPPGETFLFIYDYPGRPGDTPVPIVLCGGDSGVECRGHGTVYRSTHRVFASVFERWSKIRYYFVRDPENYNDRDDWQTFAMGEKTITGDTTLSAWYRFPEAEQAVPRMPQTGAGGMAHR
ncbi:hypothetical protein Tter_2757 [Thermobaculum terrenum ATCC BAA-798]|uniref:Uncharacterized protein n=1 Tax=Thermobaculum terrenum (strain ATCC BAA-798 / CCMEE 7001 / YNP1) TaxID=525904 RepID=D1CIS3_THET1|nr:hypothetical protein [Thermobaculum terrenum]ACZ43643.1 hypothetical protein Tter_2757 [Thermobaculum terrenum ATCC BAA-798]